MLSHFATLKGWQLAVAPVPHPKHQLHVSPYQLNPLKPPLQPRNVFAYADTRDG